MNADRSNYALISALYADKKRGLYSDIYFPIIKYAILMLYGEAESSQPYFTSQQVHDKIKDLFHIDIPTVVIAMTVMKIKEYRNGNIVLEPMAKGNNFRVISADYDEDDAAYTEKQKEFHHCRIPTKRETGGEGREYAQHGVFPGYKHCDGSAQTIDRGTRIVFEGGL